MGNNLQRGDRVQWKTSQGKTKGKIVRRLTSPTKIKGHQADASKAKPQYLVESEKSGQTAAHKPEALENISADDTGDKKVIRETFHRLVNMPPAELKRWLESDTSRSVGYKKREDAESVGHASGRRILSLLRTKRSELSDDDYSHMRKVIGYIRRHLAQQPEGNLSDTPWRHSLMNWGHDPLK